MGGMYRRCLVCGADFPPNRALELLPRGRQVAYDPERGRLWIVCPSCGRWSLVPIESRWETIEALERRVQGGARPLARTDRVALYGSPPLEVLRIGRADLREEAWWRYGRALRRRRERFRKLSAAGGAGAVGFALGSALAGGFSFVAAWLAWNHAPGVVAGGARWLRFGGSAWKGRVPCPECGEVVEELRFAARRSLVLQATEDEGLSIRIPCPACRNRLGGATLRGAEAERALMRVLAYRHFAGASAARVEGAARLIEVGGGPDRLASRILRRRTHLGRVGRTGGVALEIALHHESERAALATKVADLEARWRDEEELARIVDEELTPLPALASMRRRIAGRRLREVER